MELSLGLDFGTGSVRALVVDIRTGKVHAESTFDYPHGRGGVIYDEARPLLARQHPLDYELGTRTVCQSVVRQLAAVGIPSDRICAVGVDTTGSSPIPVAASGRPLVSQPEYRDDLDAYCWLWKDHTAVREAEEISAKFGDTLMLKRCGGVYSSEWFWSKLLHCFRTNRLVFDAAHTWIELCDYIPAWLTGTVLNAKRSVCAAGHKALYSDEWGGLPSYEQLEQLEPGFSQVHGRLYDQVFDSGTVAGYVTEEIALETGLPVGIPVAVGAFDAHMGAVGAGIHAGMLVKIIGTSTCDCFVYPDSGTAPEIPGVCGVVNGSILPKHWGIEAGQSAVGDIFDWVTRITGQSHKELSTRASTVRPGGSGLLALDWLNGNRTVLVDQRLTGLLVGLSLHTSAEELYRAMIEATAFGARRIVEQVEAYSVSVDEVMMCGGIAEKSALTMQIYANVLARPIRVAASHQTCALGAAIFGTVASGRFASVQDAQSAMVPASTTVYHPEDQEVGVYRELYTQYLRLHDEFGERSEDSVMKTLLRLRDR